MRTEAIEIKRDGLTLRGFQSLPETDEFDVAVLFHGFMMTCGRNPEDLIYQISEDLNRRGIGTVRMDFAGDGESDGSTEDTSVLSQILDAEAILRYVWSIPGIRRVFVHGRRVSGPDQQSCSDGSGSCPCRRRESRKRHGNPVQPEGSSGDSGHEQPYIQQFLFPYQPEAQYL